MWFDTGADVTLLGNPDRSGIERSHLLPGNLKTTNNKDIKMCGQFRCGFPRKNSSSNTYPIAIFVTCLLQLMTRYARRSTQPSSDSFRQCFLQEFSRVFSTHQGEGTSQTRMPACLTEARPVPYSVLPHVSQEIDRLVAADILSPNDHFE